MLCFRQTQRVSNAGTLHTPTGVWTLCDSPPQLSRGPRHGSFLEHGMQGRRRQRGQQGEQIAVTYLQRQGYRIQQQNYRSRYGEIDIIAWDGSTLVFVEVKTKTTTTFGLPQEMVDHRKQRTLTRVAVAYVQQQRLQQMAVRFDVVGVIIQPHGTCDVTHIQAAFSPSNFFLY